VQRARSLLLLPLAGFLFGASPDAGAVRQALAPQVDLSAIRVLDGRYVAPTENGVLAQLTLQAKFQEQAQTLLNQAHAHAAAAIVIDIKTSKVLVWANTSTSRRNLLLTSDTPSASLFKIVTTAALLERTRVTPRWQICTAGGEHGITREHLTRPKNGVVECGPFWQALGFSRNAAYAQLTAHYLGADTLATYAERFGFNQSLAFDVALPMGSLSAPAAPATPATPARPLELARTAIGFQNSTLSLLGATQLTHIVALSGLAPRVRIVEHAGDYTAPEVPETISRVISRTTANRLRRMLEVTIHSGTCREAFTDPNGQSYLRDIRAAGKTGTLALSPESQTASWFSGFAPSEKPEVLVGVLLHNDPVWHRKANEVARDLFRIYFASRGARDVTSPFSALVPFAAPHRESAKVAKAMHSNLTE